MGRIVDGSQMAAADVREVERLKLAGRAVDRSINGASSVVSSEILGAMIIVVSADQLRQFVSSVTMSVGPVTHLVRPLDKDP